DRVAGEQPAEDHQLGRQEQPHPQRAGLALLLEAVELVLQDARISRQLRPPSGSRSCKPPRSPPAACRSYAPAAARASATPGRSRPTGSARPSSRSPATTGSTPAE